jgi:diguanylate cyclase (GGDEF)-like protein
MRAFRGETIRGVPMVIRALGQPTRNVSCGGGPFFDATGRKLGAFVVLVDTTEVHKLTMELEHLARHDVLTGLPNGRTFESEVERAALFSGRGIVSTVLFADVDRFKTCNDRFGHVIGDTVLREIARAMKSAVRDVDTVARIGGDEFGIVLWDQSGATVEPVAVRLSDAVSAVGRAHGLDIGLSIGSAVIAPDSDASQVLAEADARMYEVKGSNEF